jgi:hypothetical protein
LKHSIVSFFQNAAVKRSCWILGFERGGTLEQLEQLEHLEQLLKNLTTIKTWTPQIKHLSLYISKLFSAVVLW